MMFSLWKTRANAPTPELDAAKSVIRVLGHELQTAADALDKAAAKLKNTQGAGMGYAASQAKMAALRARQTAQGVL
jgi:ATP-dependent 26S proteasome regulatory subunit